MAISPYFCRVGEFYEFLPVGKSYLCAVPVTFWAKNRILHTNLMNDSANPSLETKPFCFFNSSGSLLYYFLIIVLLFYLGSVI